MPRPSFIENHTKAPRKVKLSFVSVLWFADATFCRSFGQKCIPMNFGACVKVKKTTINA
jgi:hypothetical protein